MKLILKATNTIIIATTFLTLFLPWIVQEVIGERFETTLWSLDTQVKYILVGLLTASLLIAALNFFIKSRGTLIWLSIFQMIAGISAMIVASNFLNNETVRLTLDSTDIIVNGGSGFNLFMVLTLASILVTILSRIQKK